MNWNSWAEFGAMGGYGLYVWGSFGVTALVMLAETWQVLARRRALMRAPRRTGQVGHRSAHEA